MKACVDFGNGPPCVVRWTGKTGLLSVKSKTWCGQELDAADGVSQLPDTIPCCKVCEAALKTFEQNRR